MSIKNKNTDKLCSSRLTLNISMFSFIIDKWMGPQQAPIWRKIIIFIKSRKYSHIDQLIDLAASVDEFLSNLSVTFVDSEVDWQVIAVKHQRVELHTRCLQTDFYRKYSKYSRNICTMSSSTTLRCPCSAARWSPVYPYSSVSLMSTLLIRPVAW